MDFIPRFPGKFGVSCFLCGKGKSMTPFCHKHLPCWYKLDYVTKCSLHKLCRKFPEENKMIVAVMSKFVKACFTETQNK